MLKTLVLLASFLLITASLKAQTYRTIAFYNVENLFDTLDHQTNNDQEFLPEGKKVWNSARYYEKLAHINQVMDSLCHPLIIGLCEIENKAVVDDIVSSGSMSTTHAVIHVESLDKRGIDNAIIYDSTVLKLIETGIVRFDMPAPSTPSRDIIWAKFAYGSDTLLTMVNHWPSRSGGQLESEPKRLIAGIAAKEFIQNEMTENESLKLVFMGDLNDHPEDMAPSMISELLVPMIMAKSGEFGGSHNYRNEWGVLDHILVSKSFLKKGAVRVQKKSGKIHSPQFLLGEYKGHIVPNRTYGGSTYLGGYSDHLPVTIEVSLK
jgi:predicted extracellular nuclease